MIGTIRKHSKWLWWVIAGLTIISFLYWGAGPSARSNGRGGPVDYGRIYGREISQQDFVNAQNEYKIFYRLHYGEWPDKNPNLSREDMVRDIYLHLLFDLKAANLGIYISDKEVDRAAVDMLQSYGRNGQAVPIEAFVKQVLQPQGLTSEDFQRYIRHDLAIQQLVQVMGLPGELITPQAAVAEYEREHREFSVQAVFFSASNYLSGVTVAPGAVAQFYTNNLAAYRLPDRVQVNYVAFSLSNYLASAKAELAKTNFENEVEIYYHQLGPDYFPDARTPDAAKAKIRDLLIRNRASLDASEQANAFAQAVFAIEPASPDNLAIVAKQKGLVVHSPAPFGSAFGPQEFAAPAEFVKAAFGLNSETLLAGPVAGPDALYVLALVKQLPSEIEPFDRVRSRVADDYRLREATQLAQRAGTNFVLSLTRQMAAGHTFASACVAAGLKPQALPPFSLLTQELPELGNPTLLALFKQTAFSTPVGHASDFMETGDGGVVLYVQSQLPLDQTVMNAQLPQFTAKLRHARQNEAFNEWLQFEASRELRNVPALRPPANGPR